MCPFCQVVGDASNCGAQLENKFCNTEDAVCVMRSENIGLDQYTERFCAKKEDYQRLKMYCESYRDCTITMCDTSGCMVE